jgi:hypothetical protein
MSVLERLKNYIKNIEEKDMYIYLSAFFALFLTLMILLAWWHSRRISHWNTQLNTLKKQRLETKQLLTEHNQVELDRQKVNDILATDTSFKIRGFYDDLVNVLGLMPFKTKDPAEPQTTELESGEKERTLTADFNNLNMKQVTDILSYIENNPRVYTKKISIDKVAREKPTLNVTIDIATIEPSSQEA